MPRLLVALLLSLLSTAALADAVTTRIETRPYYGAIVTIEQGVRVWRALPPHDRIIIVPEGAGKVNVNVDAGSRSQPQFGSQSSSVNFLNSGNVHGGSGVVGIPYRHHRPYPRHVPRQH